MVSIALVLVLNTEQFRTSQLEKQLTGKYGVKFSLGADEQEQSFFSLTHCYMLTSDEGIQDALDILSQQEEDFSVYQL